MDEHPGCLPLLSFFLSYFPVRFLLLFLAVVLQFVPPGLPPCDSPLFSMMVSFFPLVLCMHVLIRTFISLLYCPTGRNPDKPHKKRTRFRGGNLYLLFFIGYWKRRRSLAAVIFLGSFCFLLLFIMLACYIPPVSDFYPPLSHITPLYCIFLRSFPYCLAGFLTLGRPRGKNIIFSGSYK